MDDRDEPRPTSSRTNGPDASTDEKAAQQAVLADGVVEIDLSDPPSREDLAVPDGRRATMLQREDDAAFTVRVTFSDGTVLETPARILGVETDGSGPPTGLTIRRDRLTFDELVSTLEADRERLDLDEGALASYLRAARAVTPDGNDAQAVLRSGAVAEPEFLEVKPRTHHEGSDHMVQYLVAWDAS